MKRWASQSSFCCHCGLAGASGEINNHSSIHADDKDGSADSNNDVFTLKPGEDEEEDKTTHAPVPPLQVMSDFPNCEYLPRGGIVATTAVGRIQFGMPPETIKDHLLRGLPCPVYYVVPREKFLKDKRVNVAEFEFPAYFNFFIKKRPVCLICTPESELQIRAIFQETLLGPSSEFYGTFAADFTQEASLYAPDLPKEMAYFRRNPFDLTKDLNIDTLLKFINFKDGIATITEGDNIVTIREVRSKGEYVVAENMKDIAKIPIRTFLPDPPHIDIEELAPKWFDPPLFGITMLGNSHGFDPKGTTTGFVLWMNKVGVMVDPPLHSATLLRQYGIPTNLIDAIILTHVHSDHDAGTFHKLLDAGRIKLISTATILESFTRKYSAYTGITTTEFRNLFYYYAVKIGVPVPIHGGVLHFHYSLHSIPTVGFTAYFGEKSIIYSADHCYDPARIIQMRDDGVLSPQRAEFLLKFPFTEHNIVLHEAGVPPLHTPMSVLAALAPEIKEKLYVVHVDVNHIPKDCGLKVANVGVANTLCVKAKPPPDAHIVEKLDLLSQVELFTEFPYNRVNELLLVARRERYVRGEYLVKSGSEGLKFFIISQGIVRISDNKDLVKFLWRGDFFGEMSILWATPRTADVTAVTDVEVFAIEKEAFLQLLQHTDTLQKLKTLAHVRLQKSWQTIAKNSFLGRLTSSQKSDLQLIMRRSVVESGHIIWHYRRDVNFAVLVEEGELEMIEYVKDTIPAFGRFYIGNEKKMIDNASERIAEHKSPNEGFPTGQIEITPGEKKTLYGGAFACEIDNLVNNSVHCTTLRCVRNSVVYIIPHEEFRTFFKNNPGVKLFLTDTLYVV
eukprot:TRINITY_DN5508_c0_g1_i2.p1 TRINITY_DN5508_c0_g1~~TRINITY_DN5508_c0_g1_i2.p1  ORF type:complete len:844 (-),score=163.93 TRINITY_DN5508_c0_g1_i2:46-2577(-)